jgi:hypothetical protein
MAQRSRYPAIPLPEAVAKVEKIYEQEGPNAMSSEVAAKHMGYGGLNGASLTSLAALKKYGLLEGRAEDLRVSKDGIVIVSDRKADDQTERQAALSAAFLSDPLFKELDERFAGKTTEINVTSYLQKKGFAPPAARSAARSYLESSTFVDHETDGYDWRSSNPSEERPIQSKPQSTEVAAKGYTQQITENVGDCQESPIVISGVSRWPTIKLPRQFSAQNWEDMMRMLQAMKDGFITSDSIRETSVMLRAEGANDNKTS